MVIIDKIKDFYDYQVSKWGRDEKVVYERNGCMLAEDNFYKASIGVEEYIKDYFFSLDSLTAWTEFQKHMLKNRRPIKQQAVILWTGDTFYMNIVTANYDDKGNITTVWEEYDKQKHKYIRPDRIKRESNAPIVWEIRHIPSLKVKKSIENPILEGTKYAGIVNSEKMWLDVYSYISHNNEKQISDTRTNDEKILCNGFDRKTSFRNIK